MAGILVHVPSVALLAVLAVSAASCGSDPDPESDCGSVEEASPRWVESSVTRPPHSTTPVSFRLEGIGPAPTCARRIPLEFVCGRAGTGAAPPPGQPTAACVPAPEFDVRDGPYDLPVETFTAGTYELWLATSDDGIVPGPPLVPLQIVVR